MCILCDKTSLSTFITKITYTFAAIGLTVVLSVSHTHFVLALYLYILAVTVLSMTIQTNPTQCYRDSFNDPLQLERILRNIKEMVKKEFITNTLDVHCQ
jgi:hypothetical protein